ncbi:MAG: 1-(5-phosphoribosyl)-5-amino-4-imidazole-carboxylate carboxylase, partial [Gemmatimonadota bacterium]|nr:1-(5-phosphoribosyl)-5-amino-4-imidazole-carboxylate carboxylase [Gemmatimonadota bacterium]
MNRERVRDLLAQVADGSVSVRQAIDTLAFEPFESLAHATVDHHRALRQGHPEVIFGSGKTPEQIVDIARRIAGRGDGVLATRLAPEAAAALAAAFPDIEINPTARTGYRPGNE